MGEKEWDKIRGEKKSEIRWDKKSEIRWEKRNGTEIKDGMRWDEMGCDAMR